MCLAQGQGKLPALLIARLKSLHLIGPVIHEGIIQRGSLSKTQIGSFDYQKTTGASQQMSYQKSFPFVPRMKLHVALAPAQNYPQSQGRGAETTITARLEAALSLKMGTTSLCHVDLPFVS